MPEFLKNFRRHFIINIDEIISDHHPDYGEYVNDGVSFCVTPVATFENAEGHEMTVSMTALGYFISDDPTHKEDFDYFGYDIVPEVGFDNTADIRLTYADLDDLFCFTQLDDQLWGAGNGKTGEEEMWDAVKAELTKLKDKLCANLVAFGEEPMSCDIDVLSKVLKRL